MRHASMPLSHLALLGTLACVFAAGFTPASQAHAARPATQAPDAAHFAMQLGNADDAFIATRDAARRSEQAF